MTSKAAVMPAISFKDMCKDIACEWLGEVWTEYPYITKSINCTVNYDEVVYTPEAQERYDEIFDMIEQLAFNYIIVETQEETD